MNRQSEQQDCIQPKYDGAHDRRYAELFHRLDVYSIHVPPLREHLEDIPLIAGRFGELIRRQLGINRSNLRKLSKRLGIKKLPLKNGRVFRTPLRQWT